MRVLSGLQPTGRFHWGNYFGAIRQYLDLQHGNEAYYFIANLHALTTVRNAGRCGRTRSTRPSICWPWGWTPTMPPCSSSRTCRRSPSCAGC